MKVHEINNRMRQLEKHIELLREIRQDYIEQDKDPMFIDALDDGIQYISIRLEQYKNTDWIMV